MSETRSSPASDYDFSDATTTNLIERVKARSPDVPAPNIVILLAHALGWADVGDRGTIIND